MKFAVVILAVLAVASPLTAYKLPTTGSGALAKELQDLVDLIQFDKMVPIIKAYAAKDKEVQVALKVLQSNELKLFVQDVEANSEIKILLKHIQEAGLDIMTLMKKLNDIVGVDHISPLEASACSVHKRISFARDIYMPRGKRLNAHSILVTGAVTIPELKNLLKYIHEAGLGKIILKSRLNNILCRAQISPLEDSEYEGLGGIVGLESDMWSVVPQAKLDQLVKEKFDNSAVFEDFLRAIFRDDLLEVYLSFRTNEHWLNLIQEAEQADIYSEFFTVYFPAIMAAKIILAVAV